MSGETNLERLLASASPRHNPGRYVFCTTNTLPEQLATHAVVVVREQEGITLVLPEDIARESGFPCNYVAAWITLEVHSSLEAVGLTAAFSQALAAQEISCNVVAGFYHDHLFVAAEDAERALSVLQNLGKSTTC